MSISCGFQNWGFSYMFSSFINIHESCQCLQQNLTGIHKTTVTYASQFILEGHMSKDPISNLIDKNVDFSDIRSGDLGYVNYTRIDT